MITGIPGKTGIVYTLDRETGEFLWARPTVFQNVVSDIDGATGKVTVNREGAVHDDEPDAAHLSRARTAARTGPPAPTAR